MYVMYVQVVCVLFLRIMSSLKFNPFYTVDPIDILLQLTILKSVSYDFLELWLTEVIGGPA